MSIVFTMLWAWLVLVILSFDLPAMPMRGFIAVTKSQYYAPVIILTMSMLYGRRVFEFVSDFGFRYSDFV